MIKYFKLGLILALLYFSCKIEQKWVDVPEYDVRIRLFTDSLGVKYAFQPICEGILTNRGTITVYRVKAHVTFYPYIEGATDKSPYSNHPAIKVIEPGDSVGFKVFGGMANCQPDYDIPNIVVTTIKVTYSD